VSEDNGGDGDGEFFYPGGRSPDKETLEKVNGGYIRKGATVKCNFIEHSIPVNRVVCPIWTQLKRKNEISFLKSAKLSIFVLSLSF